MVFDGTRIILIIFVCVKTYHDRFIQYQRFFILSPRREGVNKKFAIKFLFALVSLCAIFSLKLPFEEKSFHAIYIRPYFEYTAGMGIFFKFFFAGTLSGRGNV